MLIKKSKIPVSAIVTIGILPSFLKKIIYRLKGYDIGKNVSIGLGSVIIGDDVKISDGASIGFMSVIRGNKIRIERFAKIGSLTFIETADIRIGEDARINEQVIIGGMQTPESKLDLGKRTIIMEYSYINTTMPVTIGDDSGIGGHCLLFTHGSWLNQLEGFPVTFKPITLGEKVWLPWRVFIMPGVELGDEVVVGANSLINKSVKANSLIAGSPAKVIKEDFPARISDEKKRNYFETYIEEFLEFLRFNGIETYKDEQEDVITVQGQAHEKKFEMMIWHEETEDISREKSNSLIITNISQPLNSLPQNPEKGTMYLDVNGKERIGTSDVGEEFVKFVSRYGLRFSRLD